MARGAKRYASLAKSAGRRTLPQAGKRAKTEPGRKYRQYMRANWLSNRVFGDYDAIVDAGCDAWNRLIDQPETITSIGMQEWAHIGQN